MNENKLSTTFTPEQFKITEISEPDATLHSTQSDRVIHRNISHLKPIEMYPIPNVEVMQSSGGTFQNGQPMDPENTLVSVEKEQQRNRLPERPSCTVRKPGYLKEYVVKAVQVDKE